MTKKHLDGLTYKTLGAAIEVHRNLGPGLLESVYQQCMAKEFIFTGIRFQRHLEVPVDYKGLEVDTFLRCDFLVEDVLVVELNLRMACYPFMRPSF